MSVRPYPVVSRRSRLLVGGAALTLLVTPLLGVTGAGEATDATGAATDAGVRLRFVAGARTDPQRYTVRRTTYRSAGTVTTPPRIRATAWAVADLDTGRVLAKNQPRRRLPQASTIKLLTALTAVDTVARRPTHRVTRREANTVCACAGLVVGRRYTRATLLAGMLLPSGNDAAEALAGSHPHGRRAFVAAMNAKAAALGARDTVARNPSGLTDYGAHSSAKDLLVFLRAAMAEPRVAPYLSMPSAEFGPIRGRKRTIWHGTDYVTEYSGAQGKSGYTTAAKNTLVVSTDLDGRRIGVATLGAPGGYSTSGARALTLWAGRNYEALAPAGRLPALPPAH